MAGSNPHLQFLRLPYNYSYTFSPDISSQSLLDTESPFTNMVASFMSSNSSEFGIPDYLAVPNLLPDCDNIDHYFTIPSCNNNYYYKHDSDNYVHGHVHEISFTSSNETSCDQLLPPHNSNWGGITAEEDEKVKIGKYSAQERKTRIVRYLNKRNSRNFNKTIKYACRKSLADKRVRIRGRFAKNNNKPSSTATLSNYELHNYSYHQQNVTLNNNSLFYQDGTFQMEIAYNDQEFLEAAMAMAAYCPLTAGPEFWT